MSVRKEERKESKMEVQMKAVEIASYIIQKASNEKFIAKRNRWTVGEKIVNAVLELCDHIDIANSLSLDENDERDKRRLNQRLALADTFRIMTLTHIINSMSSSMDSYEHIAQLVIDEQSLIRGWIKSDKSRIASMT